MTTVVVEGHKMRLIDESVCELRFGDAYQYVTERGGKIVTCNGAGWPDRTQKQGVIPEKVAQTALRALQSLRGRSL